MTLPESVTYVIRQKLDEADDAIRNAEHGIFDLETDLKMRRHELEVALKWADELKHFLESNGEKPVSLSVFQNQQAAANAS